MTIRFTSFFVNYRRELKIEKMLLLIQHWNHQEQIFTQKLKKLHLKLKNNMDFINKYMIYYYNNKHKDMLLFKKREKIFLLRQNIKIKQLNNKLNHKKLRLFRIDKKIGKLSYRLKLLNKMRIYSVFYVSLLKKAS